MSAIPLAERAYTSSAYANDIYFEDETGAALDWTGYVANVTIEDGSAAVFTKSSASAQVTLSANGLLQCDFTQAEIATLDPRKSYFLNVHFQVAALSADFFLVLRFILPVSGTYR